MNKANQMNKIKIIHWNCFKLNQNKCKELENFLDKNSPDIMCLNEVKLDENKANFFLNFTNYVTIYKPRQMTLTQRHTQSAVSIMKTQMEKSLSKF